MVKKDSQDLRKPLNDAIATLIAALDEDEYDSVEGLREAIRETLAILESMEKKK